jgi:hypothetical protein
MAPVSEPQPLLSPGNRVRLVTNETEVALREGSATIVALRPNRQYEVLLDDDKQRNLDRLVLWDAASTVTVAHLDPATLYPADDDAVRARRAWSELPYAAVPQHTSRGVAHQVVAVFGLAWNNYAWGRDVYGVTACGKGRDGNLLLERDAGSWFPKCKRCWRGEDA